MHVRAATLQDLPTLLRMGQSFYEETHYVDIGEYCADSVADLVIQMIDTGVCLVVEDEAGKPVGMAGLLVAAFAFNRAHRAAYEVMWWVDPAAQGQGAGKALLEAIEPACRDAGCEAIQMVHLASSPPQAGALYTRMGYGHTESSYTKVL